MKGGNFANGGVMDLKGGSSELETILDSTWYFDHVLVADFSASWCGPCRILAPQLDMIAKTEKDRVALVKIDCEATQANRALCAAEGISAFPTVKIYCQRRLVSTIKGANIAEIKRIVYDTMHEINEKRARQTSSSLDMVDSLSKALVVLQDGCSSEEYAVSAQTLLTYMKNCILKSDIAKYRKIRLSNEAFRKRLGDKPGGIACLKAVGFREDIVDDDKVLLMKEPMPGMEDAIKWLGRQLIGDGERGHSSPTSQQQEKKVVTAEDLRHALESALTLHSNTSSS